MHGLRVALGKLGGAEAAHFHELLADIVRHGEAGHTEAGELQTEGGEVFLNRRLQLLGDVLHLAGELAGVQLQFA